ncbi:hypothetical protein N7462_004626 [Penicillium macrosclerotiorum]|uniref:uncharacterized protein n=1 Tax=Penicillium macrosclerotiorum TaxID=303699 RepID=UPI002546B3F4|nr:uncharacterized protein N7462_004626 [Penicillium macrosclerotiorum]KAJ5690234.1 hypothetical protein N7462_004626 [Penicillium macrosclerotiorum]
MANAPESPRRPLSAQTASHLRYPTFPPLTGSVEEWLSRSRPTHNMSSDQEVDGSAKSLGDSWATLSVSDLHSEDGSRSEQTDMGSLIDQTTPDDVASLDDRYSSSEGEGPDEDYHHGHDDAEQEDLESMAGSQKFPSLFLHGGTAIDDSNLTARPAFRQSLDGTIEFKEPETWPNRERVELKHTIHIFEDATAAELMPNPTDQILMATVQQTMTKKSLDLDKPFRVLYIGYPDFRNIILDKIGDVLVSSSTSGSQSSSAESSRYHVVPTSFGVDAQPNFAELIPIHAQLVVDECKDASEESHPSQPSTVNLDFKNRPSCRSWWDGTQYRLSSASEWTLPDVAIVFMSGRDNPAAIQTRRHAHAFLERHGIPAMMISEDPLWKFTSEPIAVNHNTLHMCVEARHSQTGETTVIQRHPIDLKTFESITPAQLNRNLASLIDLNPKKQQKAVPDQRRAPVLTYSSTDPEKYPGNWLPPLYGNRTQDLAPTLRLIGLAVISAIALSLGYAVVRPMVLYTTQWTTGSALSHGNSTFVFPVQTPPLTLERGPETAISTRSPGQVDSFNKRLPNCPIIDQLTELAIAAPSSNENLDTFEIQVVGDCHVVIKPPRRLVSSKKRPKFNVDVHRYSQVIPCDLSWLFEGVYTLRLNPEDAYGPVNVTIASKSKPHFNQTTVIDFGTPWLKVANWRRSARAISSQLTKDLQIAQTSLSEVYTRFSTDLQLAMGDVVKRSHLLQRDAELLRNKSLIARDNVLSRSKELSAVVTRNAIQGLRIAGSVLQTRSVRVNEEAKGIVSHTWSRFEKSIANVDVHSMMDRLRNVQHATLDRAQARARRFVGCREGS